MHGISHITFIVRDLERSAEFFTELLGATEVYDSGEQQYSLSREKFFVLGGVWLCLMEGESPPQRSYNHVAFKVSDEEFAACVARLEAAEVEFRPGRARVDGEAQSAYFYDYDDHLFELHTGTLEERLKRYLGPPQ